MLGVCSLFVPADAPRMINASFVFSANSLIFDLEDAVSFGEKDSARILIKEALPLLAEMVNIPLAVRINSEEEYWQKDLKLLETNLFKTVVVPKASAEHLREIAVHLDRMNSDTSIAAIIENARSLEELNNIASATTRLSSLLLGGEDYSLDIGAERTLQGEEIKYARMRIANVAAAYGLEALDTPFVNVKDTKGLLEDASYAKRLGFTGKLAINPMQVKIIQSVFRPTEQEFNWATEIMKAWGLPENRNAGVFSLKGKMIDLPVLRRAKRILARYSGKGEH